jgi:hypothetical protein
MAENWHLPTTFMDFPISEFKKICPDILDSYIIERCDA